MSATGRSGSLDVIPAFPGELVDRHLGFRSVLESHHDALLEHPEGPHLARHAATAVAALRAWAADLGQPRAQLLVGGELVEQAALEPPAVTQETAVGQRHVLSLRHLDRNGLEPLQVGGAAELSSARADAVHELGRVT